MLLNPPQTDAELFDSLWVRNTHDELILSRLQKLPLSHDKKIERAVSQGFAVSTEFFHTTADHFTHFATGLVGLHYTLFQQHDVLKQGMFFSTVAPKRSTSSLSPATYFLRNDKCLLPLAAIDSDSEDFANAVAVRRYIFSPLISNDNGTPVIDLLGNRVIHDASDTVDWVERLSQSPIHWAAFEHPDVINRLRESGFNSAQIADTFDSQHESYFMLESADIRHADSPFNPHKTDNPYLHAQRGIPMSTERTATPSQGQYAFHGSPVIFDRLTLEAVTHSEAQHPYGWGLYFTQEKDIAQWYRQAQHTPAEPPVVTINNITTSIGVIIDAAAHLAATRDTVTRDDLIEYFKRAADQYEVDPPSYLTAEGIQRELTYTRYYERLLTTASDVTINLAEKRGKVYAATIPSDNRLLIWEKPIAQQPDALRNLFADANGNHSYDKTMTGGEAYKKLSVSLGNDKLASLLLAKNGIPGLKYLNLATEGPDYGTTQYVIWDEDAIKQTDINNQLDQSTLLNKRQHENRAKISFSAKTFAAIVLGQEADPSSLLHEGSHLFLEMYSDAAGKRSASKTLQHDYQVMLDWFGLHDVTWRSLSIEERRPYHEQFAETFEVYLLTKESPIANTHSQYQEWLCDVHHDLLSAHPEAKLSADVAALFDRMLTAPTYSEKPSIAQPIYDYIYRASIDNGQPSEVATSQAAIFSSAYSRLFQHCNIEAETFLKRYSLTVHTDTNTALNENEFAQRAFAASASLHNSFSVPTHIGNPHGQIPYGWGLYFDNNRGVSELYRHAIRQQQLPTDAGVESLRSVGLTLNKFDVVAFIQYAKQLNNEYDTATNLALRLQYSSPNLLKQETEKLAKAIVTFNELSKGHIYQVDIPNNHELLHWNAPIKQQHPNIQDKLRHAGLFHLLTSGDDETTLTGGDVYHALTDYFSKHATNEERPIESRMMAKKTADYFSSIGIPGLQYLTQTTPTERGFVIWDARLVDIEAIDDRLCPPQNKFENIDISSLDDGSTSHTAFSTFQRH